MIRVEKKKEEERNKEYSITTTAKEKNNNNIKKFIILTGQACLNFVSAIKSPATESCVMYNYF